jgi:four helix bundle protein
LSKKEFVQFLAIAQRSLFETRYHLHFIRRTGLLEEKTIADLTTRCQRASRLVYGLMRSSKVTTAADSGRQRYLKTAANDRERQQ